MNIRLFEEYFGGEIRFERTGEKPLWLNRWQYRLLECLFTMPVDAISPDSLIINLFSPMYTPAIDEDSGTQNLNALPINEETVHSFYQLLLEKKVVDSTGKPSISSRYNIRQKINFPKLSGPRVLFLELTRECPLSCACCYNEYSRAASLNALKESDYENIIDQFAGLGGDFLALTGGETTSAPYWLSIAQRARDHGISSRIYTCGVYPDNKNREKVLSQLIAFSPEEIRITYAGLEESNDTIRKLKNSTTGTFRQITETVEELVANKQHVKVNYILTHENHLETIPFINFVHGLMQKHGVDIPVNIGPLRAFGNAVCEGTISSPTAEDYEVVNTQIAQIRKNLGMKISTVYDRFEVLSEEELERRRQAISLTPWPFLPQGCGFGRNNLACAFDGTVGVCGIVGSGFTKNIAKIVKDKEVFFQQFDITGNVIEDDSILDLPRNSIEEIWYSSQLLRFLQFFYRKLDCEDCFNYRIKCEGACPIKCYYFNPSLTSCSASFQLS